MRQVGDYEWHQLSLFDFNPASCVETYIRTGRHTFHFILHKTTEIVTDSHWKFEVVTSLDGVPKEIRNWRGGKAKTFRRNP